MKQQAHTNAFPHSVAVSCIYWNSEEKLLMIPVFKTGQAGRKIKNKTRSQSLFMKEGKVSHHPIQHLTQNTASK